MKNQVVGLRSSLRNEKAISKIICIGIGLVLSVVVLEISLRLCGFGYNLIWRLPKNKEADYRIFCVGESSTFGIGTDNPILDGYPHQLEVMLNNKFNLKIQCFFEQTIGVNTTEMLINLPLFLKKYKPNLVIFMAGANNWWNLNKSNILLFSKNKIISKMALKSLIFLDRFRVYKLLKWIFYSLGFWKYKGEYEYLFSPPEEKVDEERINARLKKAGKLRNFLIKKYGPHFLDICYKIAEHDISEMIKICKANNIRAIICSYPAEAERDLALIHKRLSQKFEVPFIDNYSLFKTLPNKSEYFSPDGWHPNAKGYKLIAENIYNFIIENKLIQ